MTTDGNRKCFTILEGQFVEGRGYIPSLVTENEPGHSPLAGRGTLSEPWYWGHTMERAKEIAASENAQLGLMPEDVQEILDLSIVASIRQGAAQERVTAKLEGRYV